MMKAYWFWLICAQYIITNLFGCIAFFWLTYISFFPLQRRFCHFFSTWSLWRSHAGKVTLRASVICRQASLLCLMVRMGLNFPFIMFFLSFTSRNSRTSSLLQFWVLWVLLGVSILKAGKLRSERRKQTQR